MGKDRQAQEGGIMFWIKLNIKNLPKNKVLASNFRKKSYGYKEKLIGYLVIENDSIVCESDSEVLSNCTHFVDISKYDLNIKSFEEDK